MAARAHGFQFGFAVGPAGARELPNREAAAAPAAADEQYRWLHFDSLGETTASWLREHSSLDPHALKAAVAPRARPRVSSFGDTLLVVLRAANLNEGQEREDLISLRILVAPRQILTLCRVRVEAAETAAAQIRAGQVSREPAELLALLIHEVASALQDFHEEICGRLDDFEVAVADPAQSPERADLFVLRRQLIDLIKALTPQRVALERLYREAHPALGQHQRALLREPSHRVARLVDELEAARERAAVLMEEVGMQATEELNRRIYLFTVIAGIFMPLTFLASMFGMNVGGIPMADHPQGLLIIGGVMAVIGFSIWQLLRSNRWL